MSATTMERTELEDYVKAFYRLGGRTFSGCMNDEAATIFFQMLQLAAECSDAMDLVPRPTGTKTTVKWLIKNLRRTFINRMRQDFYVLCVANAIDKWDSHLRIKCLS